MLPEAQRYI